MPASSSQAQKAVRAADYTAIKAAQEANSSVRSVDWSSAEILSLPDGTTSLKEFRGRGIVIPVSVKSIGYGRFGDDNTNLTIYYRDSKKEWKAIKADKNSKALSVLLEYT